MAKWLQLTPPLSMPERERRYLTMYTVVTGTGRAQRGCVAGRLADCAYTLGIGPPAIAEPGGGYIAFVRPDLLLIALELGGRDAWQRLRAAPGDSVAPLLAEAAQMPIDSLLARWRAAVLALRPSGGPIRLTTVMLAFGWMAAVFAGILIGARSRW
ncbi:MAG: hypothetical protein ACT4PM_02865 [Gemmatimonadales bacterium]